MDYGKLSIVIPIYNTEKTLRKCLDSLLNQTYSNLEIILVNDCSTDKSQDIIDEYCSLDKRIKCVINEENKGLFKTRINGSNEATGDFIAFLDSDDYVTIDYYRTLIYSISKNNSDMAIGNTILEYDNGSQIIHNISDINFEQLENSQVLNSYFKQEGLNFSWHTIWNKVYKMSLWKKAKKHYMKIKDHLIMTEDFAFSTVLFYYTKKITKVPNDGLYYCKHESSSTSLNGLTFKKALKNISDLIISFNFVEDFMKEVGIYEQYENNFLNWKSLYRSQQENFIKLLKLSSVELQNLNDKIEEFCPNKNDIQTPGYFSSVLTDWNNKYEEIKKSICDSQIKYVSFDIFDTLILRPFLNPSDLFILLDEQFRKLDDSSADFSKMRINAEHYARQLEWEKHKSEEIELDDIYNVLKENYNISSKILNQMKKMEIDLEYRFSTCRKSCFELYEMAIYLGKKVICISDMYLPKTAIEKMLIKNGYTQIDEIFLSSELKKTKTSGSLYKYVKKKLKISDNSIIHIGDNYNSDVLNAQNNGIKSIYMERTIDAFFDENICNNLGQLFKKDLPDWQDNRSSINFLGVRCMIAVVANKYFDNPYRSFNKNTDFNADPYLIGYYALGMHLYGVAKWLLDDTCNKYDSIAFMARDGYLPMEAYKVLKKIYNNVPNEKYLYISRKSSIPFVIKNKHDFYKISEIISWYDNKPRNILKYLDNVLDIDLKQLEELCKKSFIDLDSKFTSETDFYNFISLLVNNYFDEEKHEKKIVAFSNYFKKIFEGRTCTFDVGYSARPELYLSNLCEKPIDTYFININHEEAIKHSMYGNFKLNTFYDYKPQFTGLAREFLFSKCAPSCIKYEINNMDVIPIFEDYNESYQSKFLIETIQNSALEFVNDMVNIFGEDLNRLYYQKYYISLPYEMFIQSAPVEDRKVMSCVLFEDDIRISETLSVMEEWNKEINWHNQHSCAKLYSYQEVKNIDVSNRKRPVRIVYYAFFDRKTLKEKVKNKLKNNKLAYNTTKKVYKVIQKVRKH